MVGLVDFGGCLGANWRGKFAACAVSIGSGAPLGPEDPSLPRGPEPAGLRRDDDPSVIEENLEAWLVAYDASIVRIAGVDLATARMTSGAVLAVSLALTAVLGWRLLW